MQLLHRITGFLEVLPCHGVLGTERCLVYLGRGWGGGNTAKVDALHAIGIGGAEHRPHVV